MLSVLVVGGGPTGVEFAGELSDFIAKDLKRIDNGRAADMRQALHGIALTTSVAIVISVSILISILILILSSISILISVSILSCKGPSSHCCAPKTLFQCLMLHK